MRKTVGDYVWTTLFEGYLWGARYSVRTTDVVPRHHLNVIKYPKWRSSIMVFGQKSNERIWGLSNCFDISDIGNRRLKIDPSVIFEFGNSISRLPDHFIAGLTSSYYEIILETRIALLFRESVLHVSQRNFLPSLLRSCFLSLSLSLSFFS